MDINEVKDLIREVLQSDISEFELEHSNTRIRLKRGFSRESTYSSFTPAQAISASYSAPPPAVHPAAGDAATSEDTEDNGLHIITSPIVGTVYRSPSPGAEPYVKPGDHVSEGTILCIVEAMKLMNEIPSDVSGELARIYVENGTPVEFGQKLFAVRPQ